LKLSLTLLWTFTVSSWADTLLNEKFESDPSVSRALITGDQSRFFYNESTQSLQAEYDLLKPHARMYWPLKKPLRETSNFTATVEFSIDSIHFDAFNFCQISFGFINMANTGNRRTQAPGNSWECLTIDYFPGASYPTYTPTFITRDNGSGNALTSGSLKFPSGSTSLINDFGEIGTLPVGTQLTTSISYDAASRTITLRLADENGDLPINVFGANMDKDSGTIQLTLEESYPFSLDAFALLAWEHNQSGNALLNIHSIIVQSQKTDPIKMALPNGLPSPVFEDGLLSMTYLSNITNTEIQTFAESSQDLKTWKKIPHSVISSEPDHEVRKAQTDAPFLRLKVNHP